jgi:hypothetical protein
MTEAPIVALKDATTNSKTITEVRDLALQLIRAFGERSTAYANHQALKARQRGERLHVVAWHWIAGATLEILRSDPDEAASH